MTRRSSIGMGVAAAAGALAGVAAMAGANRALDGIVCRSCTAAARKALPAQPLGLPPTSVSDPQLRARMEASALELSERVRAWAAQADAEQVTISAEGGRLRLAGCIFHAERASRSWAILAHGYRANRRSMERYAEMYARHGFNVLAVDLRAHGESEGDVIGMGWADGQDVLEWVGYLVGRFGSDVSVVLHGQSIGAAAVVNASGWNGFPQVVAVVSEGCGTTAKGAAVRLMRKVHVLPPEPLFAAAALAGRVRYGIDLSAANPVEAIRHSTVPTLFVHGAADQVVPPSQAAELYSACGAASKKLHVVPEADHLTAALVDPQGYEDTVFGFLERVGACACDSPADGGRWSSHARA